MKMVSFLVLFLIFGTVSTVMAEEDDMEPGTFTWGLGVGGAPLGSGFSSAYSGGYGLDGNLGFILNNNTALLLEMDCYVFSTNVIGTYSGSMNFLPSIRYTLFQAGIKPYLIAGVGLNENLSYYVNNTNSYFTTSSYTSSTSFAMGLGAGIAVPINDHLDIYLQAKYDAAFASGGSFSYFPISLGVQFAQL